MKWRTTLTICTIMMLAGCTIKVEPIEHNKPARVSEPKKHHRARLPRETPTPTPGPVRNAPLNLVPTKKPTPIIHLTPTEAGVSPISVMEALS